MASCKKFLKKTGNILSISFFYFYNSQLIRTRRIYNHPQKHTEVIIGLYLQSEESVAPLLPTDTPLVHQRNKGDPEYTFRQRFALLVFSDQHQFLVAVG